MEKIIGFMFEKSIVNVVPILIAALAFAYLAGPVLKRIGTPKLVRSLIYMLIGVSAGLWSYSTFDIPDRAIESLEFAALSGGMLLLSGLFIFPTVLLRNRDKN